MHESLREIPGRILETGLAALAQANMHAVFCDPGNEHWERISVLNAALAGELVLKAIIAREHPLLIFRDLFGLDDTTSDDLDINLLIKKGRTYNFERLPNLLWVAVGERIPDSKLYEEIQKVRNSIQHFCVPEHPDLRMLSLEFIYKNIDPLLEKHFDMCAIDFHEDHMIGYDYIVDCLISREILFNIPKEFEVHKINLEDRFSSCTSVYRSEMQKRIQNKADN
ncbi:hypothetical protein PUV54_09800 [Hyphococcus flavus]|uniref:Uncharacterized protein n=1 Tax=Hyphococcus flavus TaxID=1866326 RepID=A0AAF0CEZ0_9PROT|nr:hypothetical protein [Hyphococcus flavus]WDI30253.1 hypothetical protein PUV54_09800 [Hyphococcus flavus]